MKQFQDLDQQLNMRLMQGRLGYHDYSENIKLQLDDVKDMSQRLLKDGGIQQQDRMIRDKYRSFREALRNSYQGAYIKKYYPDYIETMDGEREAPPVRALINSDKLKMDYDDKVLSVDFAHGFQIGDVFKWENTGTYWLIYLQDLTELAYFRADIRKCSYEIFWEEDGKKYSTFAAIRGPVETKIDSITKLKKSIDIPNYSLEILIPKNAETLKKFKRYLRFYLQDIGVEDSSTCWRVEAVNSISVPGIIKLTAEEYYANETKDNIKEGIVDGLVVKPVNPNSQKVENTIKGETFIKPKSVYSYTFNGIEKAQWSYDLELPLIVKKINDRTIKIKWNSTFSGKFDLVCNGITKHIVVKSLF